MLDLGIVPQRIDDLRLLAQPMESRSLALCHVPPHLSFPLLLAFLRAIRRILVEVILIS